MEIYEAAFAGIEASPVAFRRSGGTIAVRFPDPEGRTDRAGRLIPHDFVILDSKTSDIRDLQDARALLWPAVSGQYEAIWDKPAGPAPDALQ
ncbi:hypothetical protein [Microcella flavibacter]|uniref:hypothetical protein n=1 Tax=Microcella flavibacter TaxID=1804990 RepID=UPI001E338AF3|nr:hypothetical protein [Microcella flavibacter]